jgi:hypothetical protein
MLPDPSATVTRPENQEVNAMNRLSSTIAIFVLMLVTGAAVGATEVTVYKSPSCGCCKNWVAYLRANGFAVKTYEVSDVMPYKIRYGITPELASCHTALVEGYVL